MKPLLGALALSMIVAGCARGPVPRTEAEAFQKLENDEKDMAQQVPANYRQVVADEIRRSLKDPYSVRDAGISRPGYGFVGILNGGDAVVVCARMNAKNSFGAYTGTKTWAFIFRNKVIAGQIPEGHALACQARAFEPFPEIGAPS